METNRSLFTLFNLNKYNGYFDVLVLGNVSMIKMMTQFNACGINEYYAKLDQALSEWDRLSGVVANAATQVILWYVMGQNPGFVPQVIKTTTSFIENWKKGDVNAAAADF